MDIILKSQSFQEIEPFSVIGSLKLLQQFSSRGPCQQDWRQCYVYAMEPSHLFKLPFDTLQSIIKPLLEILAADASGRALSLPREKDTSNGLQDCCQQAENCTVLQRTGKVTRSITNLEIRTGGYLMRQDQQVQSLHLILEGDCKVVSMRVPEMQKQIYKKSQIHNQNFAKDLLQNKSYFSQTTNSFQLGILSANEWVGDEFLALRDQPMPYSVIATKIMRVVSISKEVFLLKMPKDIIQYIQENGNTKRKWFQRRAVDIFQQINQLKDQYFYEMQSTSKEVQRKFPEARSQILSNIRNNEIVKQHSEVKRSAELGLQQGHKNSMEDNASLLERITLSSIVGGHFYNKEAPKSRSLDVRKGNKDQQFSSKRKEEDNNNDNSNTSRHVKSSLQRFFEKRQPSQDFKIIQLVNNQQVGEPEQVQIREGHRKTQSMSSQDLKTCLPKSHQSNKSLSSNFKSIFNLPDCTPRIINKNSQLLKPMPNRYLSNQPATMSPIDTPQKPFQNKLALASTFFSPFASPRILPKANTKKSTTESQKVSPMSVFNNQQKQRIFDSSFKQDKAKGVQQCICLNLNRPARSKLIEAKNGFIITVNSCA